MSDRKSLQIRVPVELHERVRQAAAERDLSMNYLYVRACQWFVDRLIPASDIQWTQPEDPDHIVAHHHHNPADLSHTINHYSEERCGLDAFNIPRCYAVHAAAAIGDTE